MADILKLPVPATTLGYRRVRKRRKTAENPAQLDLFSSEGAQILEFAAGLSLFEQALLADERGDGRAALLYAEAVEKDDRAADACCNLGILETQAGRPMQAFDCFTNALQRNPRHSEAHYNLANLYFDMNDLRLAELHFRMAAEFDPAFANAFFNLALIQTLNQNARAARAALRRYQELAPEDEGRSAEETLRNLAQSLPAGPDAGARARTR